MDMLVDDQRYDLVVASAKRYELSFLLVSPMRDGGWRSALLEFVETINGTARVWFSCC